ncbi:hypothetical protein IWX90DRAFT_275074 [Phyllosticta citrichinensis]|uniref:Myb-like domain-containing protein n=1 Tax=Phyllosticta citrichinensis TaxID=1130410 RepID=A0ABR1XN33_9PEZI
MPKDVKASAHNHRMEPIQVQPAPAIGDPSRSTAQWLKEDDDRLMQARASGLNWQPIAARYFPNKTPNACRKRHERLMERRNAEDFDGFKLELLAQEYMNVRKEMWSLLAERVGEKWAVVEAKCMERGLKNLQAAHRAAQRKERGNYEGEDSGIGGSEAESEAEECGPPVDAGSHRAGPSNQARNQNQNQNQNQSSKSRSDTVKAQRGLPSIQSMLSPEPPQGKQG